MSPYLILGVPLFALFWNLYWLVVRPARKQRRAAMTPELRLPEGFVPPSAALAAPEPKAPRDTSRTYPRPARSRSKLNHVCPVCGMEDPGNLDGKVLGWPAHRSCAEWLGDWKSARPKVIPPPPYVPTGSITVSDSPCAQVNVGDCNTQVVWSGSGTTDPIVLIQRGMASIDEVREHLNREIVVSWGVPPAALEEHTHKVGDPVPTERCPKCGAQFAGPPGYLRTAFKMHQQMGCRQSSSSPDA